MTNNNFIEKLKARIILSLEDDNCEEKTFEKLLNILKYFDKQEYLSLIDFLCSYCEKVKQYEEI